MTRHGADEPNSIAALKLECEKRAHRLFPKNSRVREIAVRSFLVNAGVEPPDPATVAVADQIETGWVSVRALAEEFERQCLPERFRGVADLVDGLRDVEKSAAGDGRPFAAELRDYVDKAEANYQHEHGDSTRNPYRHLTGSTVESESDALSPSVADFRVYVIAARWPFERKPALSVEDLKAHVEGLHEQRLCDLAIDGKLCNETNSADIVVLPFVRSNIVICVAIFSQCLEKYLRQQGI